MTKAVFDPRTWRLAAGRSVTLGPQAVLMGIVNATPDSFSDGGVNNLPVTAVKSAAGMIADGAAILDIGAESTRPGASEINGEQEVSRLAPVLKSVAEAASDALLSVDTYRASTAEFALINGAHIINDVWGLQREARLADVVAAHQAGLVIMHTSRGREVLPDLIDDQRFFFDKSLTIAAKAGVSDEQIVLDPGFGFGKDVKDNFALMSRFEALHEFGYPLLVGTSRKRFVGAVAGREARERDNGTVATTALLRTRGAGVFRVHNVAANADAAEIADAMLAVASGAKHQEVPR